MIFLIKKFSEIQKTRRVTLNGKEVVITENALYGKNRVYILPKVNGSFKIGGVDFVRNNEGIYVSDSDF